MENNGLYLYQFHQFLEPNIRRILQLPDIKVENTIEIGVFQGYFTFNMTALMVKDNPSYRHIAIDPFTTSEDLQADVIKEAHRCFMHNLETSGLREHINFYHTTSQEALPRIIYDILVDNYPKVDLVYIDGAHTADVVLQDLVLCWGILNEGGVILCDDSGGSWMYADKDGYKPVQKSPRLAVENFIQCFWDKIEIIDLPNNWQTAFRKKTCSPEN